MSLEEAGREIRYAYFKELKEKLYADKVALAHNLDDNVETFIFRLMRGTALHGLKGIPVQRDFYIRPLLNTYKKDILTYLDNNNIDYMIDESNLESVYTRNKIRLELIPYIEENFNVNFKEKISFLIDEIIESENQIFDYEKIDLKNGIYFHEIKEFSDYIRRKIIKKYLDLNNMESNANKINDILIFMGSGGCKTIDLGKNYLLIKDYEKIRIVKQKDILKVKPLDDKKNINMCNKFWSMGRGITSTVGCIKKSRI